MGSLSSTEGPSVVWRMLCVSKDTGYLYSKGPDKDISDHSFILPLLQWIHINKWPSERAVSLSLIIQVSHKHFGGLKTVYLFFSCTSKMIRALFYCDLHYQHRPKFLNITDSKKMLAFEINHMKIDSQYCLQITSSYLNIRPLQRIQI